MLALHFALVVMILTPSVHGRGVDNFQSTVPSSPQMQLATPNLAQLFQLVDNLTKCVDDLDVRAQQNHKATNVVWNIHSAFFIFFMQAGFGMLEAGIVAPHFVSEILTKKILGLAVSAIAWWTCGYGFSSGSQKPGDDPIIGTTNFFYNIHLQYDDAVWVFSWAFATNTASIVSGALAHRLTLLGYLIINVVTMAFIHPVASYWIWSRSGWISPYNPNKGAQFFDTIGYLDMGGGSIVHMIGGLAGFIGIIVSKTQPANRTSGGIRFPGEKENITFAALGIFILFFGWFGFDTGVVKDIIASASAAQRCAFNMVISSATSALLCYLVVAVHGRYLKWRTHERMNPTTNRRLMLEVLNATLAGLVGITGAIAYVDYWAASVIGFVSCVVYFGSKYLLKRVYLSDPLQSTPVHCACGLWGVIAAGLFSQPEYLVDVYAHHAKDYDTSNYGMLVGGGGKQFALQCVGAGILLAWTLAMYFPIFFVLLRTGQLKNIKPLTEGNDSGLWKHGSENENMVSIQREHNVEHSVEY